MNISASRRRFLINTGWIAGGITVLGVASCSIVPPLPTFKVTPVDDIDSWVQLKPDGQILFYLPRAEMGQGIATGLSQIVAEELNIPLSNIDCRYQSTDVMAPCQMTVGSQSMENYWRLTAISAATLREHLKVMAAAHFNESQTLVEIIENGFISSQGLRLHYKQLASNSPEYIMASSVDANIELFSERENYDCRSVGKVFPAVNLDKIITGRETYSRDVFVEGMVHGHVLHPPHLGAELQRFNKQAAESIDDVIAVVEFDDQVGIVALTPMALKKGMLALNADWSSPDTERLSREERQMDIDLAIKSGALDHELLESNSAMPLPGELEHVSLRFDTPMVAHAALEPRSAVAHWGKNEAGKQQCEVWTACQDPWLVQGALSKLLSLGRSRIIVRNHRLGGGFGGRVVCQAALEAGCLSKAVGKPVKVQWTRENEFKYNYVGPRFSTRVDARLDANGRIASWQHRAVSSPILTSSAFIPSYLHWAVDKLPDPGTSRGMVAPYAIASLQIDFADVRLSMPTGPWRGLGAAPNAFTVESTMDELAFRAGQHPIDFRVKHSNNDRFIKVLNRIKALTRLESAVGYAAAIYKDVTYVAVAATVDRVDGRVRVKQLWCVHDCGRVISPDQVRAQIEGNLVWGVGMALREQYIVKDGISSTINFDQYRLARQVDIPTLNIELLESREAPSGAAEAALAPTAAAIANAVFAASHTKKNTDSGLIASRITRLPIDS